MDGCRRLGGSRVPPVIAGTTSPLQWRVWRDGLEKHPDRCLAAYITNGVREGFRIGFRYQSHHCKRAKANMKSATEQADVVRSYLAEECALGRVIGPLDLDAWPDVQISRFGVIPKSSGGWRLILDLSAPEGASVNDGVDADLCSLSYVTVEDAARAVRAHGRGCLLAKVDVKQAYRMVQVHPEDRLLLGISWEGALYVDTALPFGLRSAPKIFNALAGALEWMVRQEGVQWVLHYLDDFLLVGAPRSGQCGEDLRRLLSVFERLRVPIASEKLEGPTERLTFLGIEIDSQEMTLRLPVRKLLELKSLIAEWATRKSCTKRDLQSMVGKLQHACKVVRPGRTFLRRMFELLKGVKKKDHFIRLNAAFRSDLRWWQRFLEEWNGVSMIAMSGGTELHLYSDASGSFGCGAWQNNRWFQFAWPADYAGQSIATKELVPIVMACVLWGEAWRNQQIVAHCDNQAVVEVVNAGYCKDPALMQLLRCLFFVTAYFELAMRAVHVPGHLNSWADAISQNNAGLFLSQATEASRSPSPVPLPLVDLLLRQKPDWTSEAWSRLFVNSLRPV